MDNDRVQAIGELAAALSALESGRAPAPFVGGHGVQSRLFEFAWRDPSLEIDFRLPWGLAHDGEESRRARDAEIGSAIRLAVLLLQNPAAEGGGRIAVAADARSVAYSVFGSDGALEDAGDDWAPLARRLESAVASSARSAIIIWP